MGDAADRATDLGDRLARFPRGSNRSVHQLLTLLHGTARLFGTLLQLGNDGIDLGGGVLSALGQSTHLISHHRKPPPLLTGTGRFNRRIQCQQVGLFGNTADHLQHHTDIAAVIAQLADHHRGTLDGTGDPFNTLNRVIHRLRTKFGRFTGRGGGTGRIAGVARNLLHRSLHLVHRRCQLIQLMLLSIHVIG